MIANRTIVVLASATRTSGAYTIYKQFLSHLKDFTEGYKFYIFVDEQMIQPTISDVTYIHENNHSWLRRIYMDNIGWNRVLRKYKIKPDLIISLQNTGMVTTVPQLIYYHVPLSFYPNKWNPLKKQERIMFLYKHVYPLFVKRTLSSCSHIVVQIPFIKKAFMKSFRWPDDHVHVLFPDLEHIDINVLQNWSFPEDEYHFVYPATAMKYKQHITLAKALKYIKETDKELYSKIYIHFTILEDSLTELKEYIILNDMQKHIIFEGVVSHDSLLGLYKSCRGLLFPSSIETLGLPLLEAARFGLPIVAASMDYAKEVLKDYEGATYVPYSQDDEWAKSMIELCKVKKEFNPLVAHPSSWPEFFHIAFSLL